VDVSDASTIVMNADGSHVNSIANKGSWQTTFSNGTVTTSLPTYSPTGLNGLPALQFAGGQILSAGYGASSGLSTGSSAPSMMAVVGKASGGRYVEYGGKVNGSTRGIDAYYTTTWEVLGSGVASARNFNNDALGVVNVFGLNAGAVTGYIDGGSMETGTLSYNTPTAYSFTFGRGAVEKYFLTGFIQESLVFNYILSDSDRQKLEGYLAWKWGMQSLLPDAHPYKSAAPTTGASAGTTISAQTGAFQLSGVGANLLRGYAMPISAGAYGLTGNQVVLRGSRLLTAAPGSYSLLGKAVNLLTGHLLPAGKSDFSFVGQAINLGLNRSIGASKGSFALNGMPVALTKIGARSLMASTGAFLVVVSAANLAFGHRFLASSGIFSTSGKPASFPRYRRFGAGAAAFALASVGAGLLLSRRLAGEPGIFSFAGLAALFDVGASRPPAYDDFIVRPAAVSRIVYAPATPTRIVTPKRGAIMELRWPDRAPETSRRYGVDLTDFSEGRAIVKVVFQPDGGLELVDPTWDGLLASVRVRGGTPQEALVRCIATFDDGDTDVVSVAIATV
jgi:hypothetical protein